LAAGDPFQVGEGFWLLEVLEQPVLCRASAPDCCGIGWVWAFVPADADAPADADDEVFARMARRWPVATLVLRPIRSAICLTVRGSVR
jgi:hypothetical protein